MVSSRWAVLFLVGAILCAQATFAAFSLVARNPTAGAANIGFPFCTFYDASEDALYVVSLAVTNALIPTPPPLPATFLTKWANASFAPGQESSFRLSNAGGVIRQCVNMFQHPYLTDRFIICLNIRDASATNGQILSVSRAGEIVASHLAGGQTTLHTCGYDQANSKLWFTSKDNATLPARLRSLDLLPEYSTGLMPASSDMVIPNCNNPTTSSLVLTQKHGYFSCDLIQPQGSPVFHWKLSEPVSFDPTPLGAGQFQPHSIKWDKTNKKLFVGSKSPSLALQFDVDEDAPSWTLVASHIDSSNADRLYVALDEVNKIAIWRIGINTLQIYSYDPLYFAYPHPAWVFNSAGGSVPNSLTQPIHIYPLPGANRLLFSSVGASPGTLHTTLIQLVKPPDCNVTYGNNCTSCTIPGDYYCSWCLRRNDPGPDGACTAISGCSDAPLSRVCPAISSVHPTSGSTGGSTLVTVSGTGFSRADTKCLFELASPPETHLVEPVSIDSLQQNVYCLSPSTATSGAFTAGVVRGSVSVSTGYRVPTPQPYTFYNCTQLTDCAMCNAPSYPECKWCLYEAACQPAKDSCLSNFEISNSATCPKISTLTPASELIVPPTGSTLTVSGSGFVRISDLGLFTGYQCVFNLSSSVHKFTATYDEPTGAITCPLQNVPTDGDYDLKIYYRDRAFTSNSKSFHYYNCSAYTTCAECSSVNQQNCGWCLSSRSCQLTNQGGCTDMITGACPAIDSVSPPSAFKGDTPTLTVSGGTFTSNDPDTWECDFGALGRVAATRSSSSALTCPAPTYTSFSSRATFPLSIFHGGQIYTETPSDFLYYDCNNTASCGQCLGPATPLCSYCISTATCAVSNPSCTVSKANTCPGLTNVHPSATTPTGGIDITITGEFLPSLTYQCRFELYSVNFSNTNAAIVNNATITCPVPAISLFTTTLGAITVGVDIIDGADTVRYSESVLPLDVYVCSEQSSCSGCSIAPQCNWCVFSSCSEAACPSGVTLNSLTGCPSLSTLTPSHAQYDELKPVLVTGSFVSPGSFALRCKWSAGALTFSTEGLYVDSTTVKCTYDRIVTAIQPNTDLSLQLVLSSGGTEYPYSSNSKPFTIIDCAATPKNCTQCSANVSPFCGWCLNSFECLDVEDCTAPFWTRSTCPTITDITPKYGLLQGGSTVTVTGTFLVASETGGFDVSCLFGDSVTDATLVDNSTIQCQSPSTLNETTVSLSIVHNNLQATLFSQNTMPFQYIFCKAPTCGECFSSNALCDWCVYEQSCSVSTSCNTSYPVVDTANSCPSVTQVSPASGAIAGGTEVTIFGTLFVDHPNMTCLFDTTSVPAHFVNSTQITCVAPAAVDANPTEGKRVDVIVQINGEDAISSPALFNYRADETPTPSGINEGQIALIVLLIIAALAITGGIIFFILFRKRTQDERDNKKWLKLRTPDFEKVAYALNADLDYELTSNDVSKLKKLEKVLDADEKFDIVFAIGQLATNRELDSLCKAMLYYYASKGKALPLLSSFVAREIRASEHEGTLFRATSVACKIFAQYAKFLGLPYIWNHLAFFVNQLHEFGKEERQNERNSILGPGTMEVDPERLEDLETPMDEVDIRLNQLELLLRASKVLKSISRSYEDLPLEFRILSKQVKNEVGLKFPGKNADYKAVGGFLFLRFICPSMMAPHVFGLIEEAPNDTSQRYFVLLAKTLQNLANETLPGNNEDFMVKLNSFVTENIPNFHKWVDNVTTVTDEPDKVSNPTKQLPISDSLKNSSLACIMHCIFENRDKLETVQGTDKDSFTDIDALAEKVGAPGKQKQVKKKKKKAGK